MKIVFENLVTMILFGVFILVKNWIGFELIVLLGMTIILVKLAEILSKD